MKRFKKYVGWTLIIICSFGSIFGGGWFLFIKPTIDMISSAIRSYPITVEEVVLRSMGKMMIAWPIIIWSSHKIIDFGVTLLDD